MPVNVLYLRDENKVNLIFNSFVFIISCYPFYS